jgi:hypothetical protein
LSCAPNHVSRVGEYVRAGGSARGERDLPESAFAVRGDDTHAGREDADDAVDDANERWLPNEPAGLGHALGDVGDAVGEEGSSAASSRRRIRSAYWAWASACDGVPGAPPSA